MVVPSNVWVDGGLVAGAGEGFGFTGVGAPAGAETSVVPRPRASQASPSCPRGSCRTRTLEGFPGCQAASRQRPRAPSLLASCGTSVLTNAGVGASGWVAPGGETSGFAAGGSECVVFVSGSTCDAGKTPREPVTAPRVGERNRRGRPASASARGRHGGHRGAGGGLADGGGEGEVRGPPAAGRRAGGRRRAGGERASSVPPPKPFSACGCSGPWRAACERAPTRSS